MSHLETVLHMNKLEEDRSFIQEAINNKWFITPQSHSNVGKLNLFPVLPLRFLSDDMFEGKIFVRCRTYPIRMSVTTLTTFIFSTASEIIANVPTDEQLFVEQLRARGGNSKTEIPHRVSDI